MIERGSMLSGTQRRWGRGRAGRQAGRQGEGLLKPLNPLSLIPPPPTHTRWIPNFACHACICLATFACACSPHPFPLSLAFYLADPLSQAPPPSRITLRLCPRRLTLGALTLSSPKHHTPCTLLPLHAAPEMAGGAGACSGPSGFTHRWERGARGPSLRFVVVGAMW